RREVVIERDILLEDDDDVLNDGGGRRRHDGALARRTVRGEQHHRGRERETQDALALTHGSYCARHASAVGTEAIDRRGNPRFAKSAFSRGSSCTLMARQASSTPLSCVHALAKS